MIASVLAWEGAAAALFWRAGCMFRRPSGRSALFAAPTAALLLWAAFMVADEIFIAYAVEGTHVRLLVATAATLLIAELHPET